MPGAFASHNMAGTLVHSILSCPVTLVLTQSRAICMHVNTLSLHMTIYSITKLRKYIQTLQKQSVAICSVFNSLMFFVVSVGYCDVDYTQTLILWSERLG